MAFVNNSFFLIFPGALISGFSIYIILSYLLIPIRITLPLSIIISVLIGALTKYYADKEENTTERKRVQTTRKELHEGKITNIVFVVVYLVLLAVLANSSSHGSSGLFTSWEKITLIQALDLTAAIAFSFFLPGYALVTILNKKYKFSFLLKLLLAYLFSILITGLGGYASGSFGYAISNTSGLFIGSYILIFLFYLQQVNAFSRGFYHVPSNLFHHSLCGTKETLRSNYLQYIIFSSLLALVILYTYYLNDGKIVVDQWYQHGKALLIGSGLFKDLGPSDLYNPPFLSSLLAAFFNLSGSPSVNAYVMISFLNIVPVFAFYYFFTNWISKDKQRAALLASTLFMLSAGFGWLYAINTAVSYHNQVTFDVSSALEIVSQTYRRTLDVETPTTFIDVGHPDVTTPLIIIALPAGFTLLGLIKEVKLFNLNNGDDNRSPKPKSRYFRILTCIAIVTAISFLGILSHDEFILFIIVASTAIVILFRLLPKNVNYSIFFVSFLSAISLVILVDTFISPARFYTSRYILGLPLIILCFLFVSFSWTLYMTFRKIRFSNMFRTFGIKKQSKIKTTQAILKRIFTLNFLKDYQIQFLKFSLGIAIVLVVAYFYLFTLLVWEALSVNEISSQIKEFVNVPWYLYPMKFGLTGLLGLAFILSWLFKKFEKEILIFGIIIIVAFLAGPYYDEHRFGKYIMAGMAAFAALLIYQIISSRKIGLDSKLRPLIVGILLGIVVTSSGLSIFIYPGWIELFTGKSDWIEGGRRDFPTTSEIQLLNFLNNKVIDGKVYNIALPEKETTNEKGFVTKIYGFLPTSKVKLLQSPQTLNSSTLEGLYNLLNQTDVRYIILPKKGLIVDTTKEGVVSSSYHNYNDNISKVLRFVLDNFPKAYEDQNYLVLEVLPLTASSPKSSSVALIYQKDFDDLLPQVTNKSTILPIDLGLFGSQTLVSSTKNNSIYHNNTDIKKVEGQNKNLSSTAYSLLLGGNVTDNNSKNITLWSQPIREIQQHNNSNNSKNNLANINYIEANLKIIDDVTVQNKSELKNAKKFGAGILWEHDNKKYFASISDVGLKLSQSPSETAMLTKPPEAVINNTVKRIQASIPLTLSQNEEIKRQKGIWYNLKILLLNNSVEIYVNDLLSIKVPTKDKYPISSNEKNIADDAISRVGINTYYSETEFQPITLGRISEVGEHFYSPSQKIYYGHYYPLSILALSKTKYDEYVDGDMSVFSKKYVLLPFDKATYQKDEAAKYLDYVSKGGNLIVFNSDNKFDGIFSKLLSIKPGNLTKFNSIESYHSGKLAEKKYSLNVTGIARIMEINSSYNLAVKSYYVTKDNGDEDQSVAPFVIEKSYGNGKIVFVNAFGYFDAIFGKSYSNSKSDLNIINQYFATLSNVAPLIGIPDGNQYVETNSSPQIKLNSTSRVVGDMKISPMQTIMINSSTLLLPNSNGGSETPASYNLSASSISVSVDHPQQISFTRPDLLKNNITNEAPIYDPNSLSKETGIENAQNNYNFKKVIIKDLKLYGGPFEIMINVTNSNRPIYLPTSSSYYDNIAMSIPKGFDMTVRFSNNNSTYAQFDIMKKDEINSLQRIKVSGYHDSNDSSSSTGQILFRNVATDIRAISYITSVMKSPEIKIINDHNRKVEEPIDDETTSLQFRKNSPESVPIKIPKGSGDIKINVDHVDNYNEPYHSTTKTQYITYLKNEIQITNDDKRTTLQDDAQSLFTKLLAKKPGDISEYAKEHGIEVPWREVLSSTPSHVIVLILLAVFVIAIALTWSNMTKLNRIK